MPPAKGGAADAGGAVIKFPTLLLWPAVAAMALAYGAGLGALGSSGLATRWKNKEPRSGESFHPLLGAPQRGGCLSRHVVRGFKYPPHLAEACSYFRVLLCFSSTARLTLFRGRLLWAAPPTGRVGLGFRSHRTQPPRQPAWSEGLTRRVPGGTARRHCDAASHGVV